MDKSNYDDMYHELRVEEKLNQKCYNNDMKQRVEDYDALIAEMEGED